MGFPKAMVWITICALTFGAIGAVIGNFLGTKMPGYYRSVFGGGNDPGFDPVAVGLGQGLTQGLVLGSTIGLILVLASWWKEFKLASLTIQNQSPLRSNLANSKAESEESEVRVNN